MPDDVGFIQWGATTGLVTIAFWERALDLRGFRGPVRNRLEAMVAADRRQLADLQTVLGADTPTLEDFEVRLPRTALSSPRRAVAFARELHEQTTRTYLGGVGEAADPGTRALLAGLLVQELAHLHALDELAGAPSSAFAGRPGPLTLEQAGAWLDRHLRVR